MFLSFFEDPLFVSSGVRSHGNSLTPTSSPQSTLLCKSRLSFMSHLFRTIRVSSRPRPLSKTDYTPRIESVIPVWVSTENNVFLGLLICRPYHPQVQLNSHLNSRSWSLLTGLSYTPLLTVFTGSCEFRYLLSYLSLLVNWRYKSRLYGPGVQTVIEIVTPSWKTSWSLDRRRYFKRSNLSHVYTTRRMLLWTPR